MVCRKIQTELEIPTISQRLYYRGCELVDNAASLGSLGVLSHDVLDLKEDSEDIDLLGGSGSEREQVGREEGRGFGGTLLGYSSSSSPPQTPPQPTDDIPSSTGISCPACTFDNSPDAFACAICETLLRAMPD